MKMEIIQEIKQKEEELENLKERYNLEIDNEREKVLKSKLKGMKKSLYLLSFNFESSSIRTEQYLEFHRVFKRELKEVLKPYCKKIEIGKPNHFDISGFFELNDNRIYYFSLSDLRWSKEKILIRTVKDFKDYSGGSNGFIKLDSDFVNNLLNFLGVKIK